MKRKIVVLALTLVVTVLAVPALGQSETPTPGYTAPTCTAALDNPAAGPGDTVTISGTCDPDAVITATLLTGDDAAGVAASAVTVLGTTTADVTGAWSLTVAIPPAANERTVLQVTASNSAFAGVLLTVVLVSGTTTVVPTQPPTPTPPAPLAFTGAYSGVMAIVAVALIVAGAGLVVLTRRRRGQSVEV